METTLGQIISEYSMGNTQLEGFEISKEHFIELLSKYFNDKNSSTLREEMMCYISGIESNPNKLGYDGKTTNDENKPKNFDTSNPKAKKLNGSGNYSDMTHKRDEKFKLDNPTIHIGGFVNGRLMYQLKIQYNSLGEHFKKQLNKRLPDGDVKNNYLRSMTFSLKVIQECKDVELEFLNKDIEKYRDFITKTLYTYLNKLKKYGIKK